MAQKSHVAHPERIIQSESVCNQFSYPKFTCKKRVLFQFTLFWEVFPNKKVNIPQIDFLLFLAQTREIEDPEIPLILHFKLSNMQISMGLSLRVPNCYECIVG